jgi:hypothetical protein
MMLFNVSPTDIQAQFMVVLTISILAFASADHFFFAYKKATSKTFYDSFSTKWHTLLNMLKV